MNKKKVLLIVLGSLIILVIIILLVFNVSKRHLAIKEENKIVLNLSKCLNANLSKKVEVSEEVLYKEEALEKDAYKIEISSNCNKNNGYNLYLATNKDNKIDDKVVKYIITNHNSKDIIKEGILGEQNNIKDSFSDDEHKKLNNYTSIYLLFNDFVPEETKEYDIHLYVDRDYVDKSENLTGSFQALLITKVYESGD